MQNLIKQIVSPNYINETLLIALRNTFVWLLMIMAVILLPSCNSKSGKRLENRNVAITNTDSVPHFLTHPKTYTTPTTYYLRSADGGYLIEFNDDVNAYEINETLILVDTFDNRDSSSSSYLIKYNGQIPADVISEDDLTILHNKFIVEFKTINKPRKKE